MKNLTKIAKLTTLLIVVSLILVITIDVITNGAKML